MMPTAVVRQLLEQVPEAGQIAYMVAVLPRHPTVERQSCSRPLAVETRLRRDWCTFSGDRGHRSAGQNIKTKGPGKRSASGSARCTCATR